MVQAQESHPFRAEPPRILHYRKCRSPGGGGRATELDSVHEVTKELCDIGVGTSETKRGRIEFFGLKG